MLVSEARKVLENRSEWFDMLEEAKRHNDTESIWFCVETMKKAQPVVDEANKTLHRH